MPFPIMPAELLDAITALSPANDVAAAYIPQVSASVTIAGGKATVIADCSGNGAAPMEIQEASGTAVIDATTGILHTNNHWYKTPGGFNLGAGEAKSVLSCAQIRDNAGTVFDWWPSSWVAPWDVPMGVTNDSGVNAATRATNTQQPILHDNAPTLMGPSEWGVYAFYSGRNVTTQLRAQGFNYTGSVVSNGAGGWVGNSLHMGWLGNGNRDNYHLAHIVLNGEFTYEQSILFERWCKTRTLYPDVQTPKMLGTNPQMFAISNWPAGPLKFIHYVGTSIDAGVGTTGSQAKYMWLIYQALGNTTAFVDHAYNGYMLQAALDEKKSRLSMNPLNNDNTALICLGTNDLCSLDAAAEHEKYKQVCLYHWGLGIKPIAVAPLKRTEESSCVGFEAERVAYRALMAAQWPTYAYAYVDPSTHAGLQTPGVGNPNWDDGAHPDDDGHVILAGIYQPVIEAVQAMSWVDIPSANAASAARYYYQKRVA